MLNVTRKQPQTYHAIQWTGENTEEVIKFITMRCADITTPVVRDNGIYFFDYREHYGVVIKAGGYIVVGEDDYKIMKAHVFNANYDIIKEEIEEKK